MCLKRPAIRIAITTMTFCLMSWCATAQLAPYVHTQPAGPISATSATLNGVVVPNGLTTWAWFEWGTNHSYNATTAAENVGNGRTIRYVRMPVAGLRTNGVFQCWLVASNAAGVVVSHPHYFTTGAKLAAWGHPHYGRLRLPKGEGGFVALAGGISADNILLKNDGAVRVLASSATLTNVPAEATNIAAVAMGFNYCLALRSNQTAFGWPSFYFPWDLSVYPDIVAVAAGGTHMLGLRANGRVFARGSSSAGQLSIPTPATNIVALSAGYEHSVALRADGRVFAWGDNTYGQTGVPSNLSNVVAVACGFWHTFALKKDGTVVTWGTDVYGVGYLQVPAGLSNVVAIAAGKYHNLALRTDGTVATWGEFGQALVPADLSGVVSVAGNVYHSMALAPNLPPQIVSKTETGAANHDLVILLQASDLNNDDLALRITILPAKGVLYQFAAGVRGDVILSSNTPVTDPERRVIFVPLPDEFGSPYASFNFAANDGETDSAPGTIDLTIIGRPYVATHMPGPVTTASARLRGMVVPNGLPTAAWFEWGANDDFTEATPPELVGAGDVVLAVNAAVTNLLPNHPYSCRLVASNAAGVAVGPASRFITGGRVAGWGRADDGQAKPPTGLINVVAVAGGVRHSLALTTEGTLVAWGSNAYGQTNVPPDFSNIAMIAAGPYYNAAIGADGQPRVWGDVGISTEVTNIPSGLGTVFALACGGGHLLALREEGTIVAWGSNTYGQTNVPSGLSNVVAVAAGTSHSVALKADGTVTAWGSNQNGQTSIPNGLSNIVAIACGDNHSLALNADGRLVAWGHNGSGQTNVPSGLSNVVAVAAGAAHSITQTDTGELWAWGNGFYGQNTVPEELQEVVSMSAGSSHNLTVGPNTPPTAAAQAVSGIANHDLVITLAGADLNGDALSFRITSLPTAGALFQFDSGGRGAPILSAETPINDLEGRIIFVPEPNQFDPDYGIFEFRANDGELDSAPASILIGLEGTTYAHTQPPTITTNSATLNGVVIPNGYPTVAWFEWGTGNSLDENTPPLAVGADGALGRVSVIVTNLASGGTYCYRLVASNATGVVRGAKQRFTTRGKLVAWGRGLNQIPLIPPPALDRIVAVAAGRSHAVALNRDGTTAAFPMDGLLQSSVITNVPPSVTNVMALAAGDSHTLALRADGTVVACGLPVNSQLNVPSNLSNVIAIAAGGTHNLALRSNGTLVAWGGSSLTPGAVPAGLSNVVAIAAEGTHNLALRGDGRVFAWGGNTYGQTNLPAGLTNVVAVAAGSMHSLALRADGTVVAWGGNWSGQTNAPAGLSNVVAIAGGHAHSLALQEDGKVIGWGVTVASAVPTNLSAAAIAADSNYGLAVTVNIPPQALDRDISGPANSDLTISLAGVDADDDSVTFRVVAAPTVGRLYQFAAGSRGSPLTVGIAATDPDGRVIFAPAANGHGNPYTQFAYVANDGELDSPPASAIVRVAAPVTPVITSSVRLGSGAFQLSFTGHSNTTYCVWTSTNLTAWEYLDFPAQTSPGHFGSTDSAAASLPQRFYRISTECGPPAPALGSDSTVTEGAFEVRISGGPYWTYRVWASTNLVNWELIGTANETAPGRFLFMDSDSVQHPQRFYKAGAP